MYDDDGFFRCCLSDEDDDLLLDLLLLFVESEELVERLNRRLRCEEDGDLESRFLCLELLYFDDDDAL